MTDDRQGSGWSDDLADHVGRLDRQIQREREAALREVEPLLERTSEARWPALAEHPLLQTCGALSQLATIVNRELTARPRYAEAVAQLAVSVSEGLPEAKYSPMVVAQIRAMSWKGLGKVLGFLGRYDESLEALSHAEALITGYPALVYDLAIARFNRALTLQEMDRHEESFALFSECKQTFREYGDTRLIVICGFAEGVLLQRLQEYRAAREAHLLILASTLDIDPGTRAALHQAIGLCSMELGDFIDAEANLVRSVALNRELGQPVEALKGEMSRGRLLLRKGEPEAALEHLRPVRRELLRHTLNEEAGICGLEMVSAYLLLDRPDDAEQLAGTIVTQFTAANLNGRAAIALGYLSEAIAARRATTALVKEVREYIISLRTSPERDFKPRHATDGAR